MYCNLKTFLLTSIDFSRSFPSSLRGRSPPPGMLKSTFRLPKRRLCSFSTAFTRAQILLIVWRKKDFKTLKRTDSFWITISFRAYTHDSLHVSKKRYHVHLRGAQDGGLSPAVASLDLDRTLHPTANILQVQQVALVTYFQENAPSNISFIRNRHFMSCQRMLSAGRYSRFICVNDMWM